MNLIDLRSDTVTKPTQEMLKAMASAELGDDVSREDPTVNSLEEMAAEITGKEAGLLVTSGTMGNLVAVLTHAKRGDEVLLEAESHIYFYEVGGMAALAGVMPRLIAGEKGKITREGLELALRPANIHFPKPSLLCLENTHNRAGGRVSSVPEIQAAASEAHKYGLKVHLDGARVFNAALALDAPVSAVVKECDSVMFCLSKGLAAPVGSVLVGSREFIDAARKWRKMLGGGMRQAGVIAAAGIVALRTMTERLAEDHENAKFLAGGLSHIPGLRLNPEAVQTNIVVVEIDPVLGGSDGFLSGLAAHGVLATNFGPNSVRFVTHKDVNRAELDAALRVISSFMGERNGLV